MKIHEYQAKAILARFGIPVPRGEAAHTPEDVRRIAAALGGPVVVKAQIHAGGRGKGAFRESSMGGVRVAQGPDAAVDIARHMLGGVLVTKQTGPEGREVRTVLVEEALEIARELYLALLVDRTVAGPVCIASAEGGTDIEEVAALRPEAILKVPVDPRSGFSPWIGRAIAFGLGFPAPRVGATVELVSALHAAFVGTDASLAEINPLVLTGDSRLLALDAKMSFDDNALWRRPEVMALRDPAEEDPLEVQAASHGLNYVKLGGDVACMVNGAGLAMATMDLIKHHGGSPANFLDVGGGASQEMVTAAFRILLGDPNVRAVLINIFGGIMRCDVVAEGVVAAASSMAVEVPVVVRLEGTNVEGGRQILRESGLRFQVADGMKDAAEKVVAAARR